MELNVQVDFSAMEEGLEEMKMHLASFIVNLKDYKEERTLGKGAYGKV